MAENLTSAQIAAGQYNKASSAQTALAHTPDTVWDDPAMDPNNRKSLAEDPTGESNVAGH